MSEPHHEETRTNEQAPPDPGGACGDIDIVEAAEAWRHDGAGYPPEAGLDEPDPERLPEHDGMAEDPPASPPTPRERIPGLQDIGTHLDELRRRLIVSFAVFVPFFAVGLWQYQNLWRIVTLPLNRSAPSLLHFQALNPSDGLVMAMRIAFAFALFLSLPVWLAQFWGFVSPGLTARERRWMHLSIGSGGVLFALGVAVAYFAGVPFALDYLLPFNQSLPGWENAFTGSGYVDFVITCCAGFGVAFELPLVMLALGWFGILTPEAIRGWWRGVVLIIFVVAAVLTPPDPFTQMLLAVPMLGLFYLGYWLVKWTQRNHNEQ